MFKQAYIPRTLTEVSHYERDVDVMKEESAVTGHHDSVRTPEGLECSQSPDSSVDIRNNKVFPPDSVSDADWDEKGSFWSSEGKSSSASSK